MPDTKFIFKPHGELPGKQIVEVWSDGVFVATIYPHEDGILIISKYMDGVKQGAGYPPSVVISLSRVR